MLKNRKQYKNAGKREGFMLCNIYMYTVSRLTFNI